MLKMALLKETKKKNGVMFSNILINRHKATSSENKMMVWCKSSMNLKALTTVSLSVFMLHFDGNGT